MACQCRPVGLVGVVIWVQVPSLRSYNQVSSYLVLPKPPNRRT